MSQQKVEENCVGSGKGQKWTTESKAQEAGSPYEVNKNAEHIPSEEKVVKVAANSKAPSIGKACFPKSDDIPDFEKIDPKQK